MKYRYLPVLLICCLTGLAAAQDTGPKDHVKALENLALGSLGPGGDVCGTVPVPHLLPLRLIGAEGERTVFPIMKP